MVGNFFIGIFLGFLHKECCFVFWGSSLHSSSLILVLAFFTFVFLAFLNTALLCTPYQTSKNSSSLCRSGCYCCSTVDYCYAEIQGKQTKKPPKNTNQPKSQVSVVPAWESLECFGTKINSEKFVADCIGLSIVEWDVLVCCWHSENSVSGWAVLCLKWKQNLYGNSKWWKDWALQFWFGCSLCSTLQKL